MVVPLFKHSLVSISVFQLSPYCKQEENSRTSVITDIEKKCNKLTEKRVTLVSVLKTYAENYMILYI